MKSVVIVLLLAASAVAQVPAPGQGDWVPLGNGYYRGNSWVWKVTQNCYGQYCYAKAYPVVTVPVVGRADFYEQALASLTKQQSETEQRQFLQQMFPVTALQTAGYSNGYTKTGVSVYQQGYVQGGQTLYGTASYAASNVDVNGIIHEAQRLADRVLGASEAAVAGAQDIVATAVDGNSKAAQITASAQVAAAAIQAANPPVQRVEATKVEPSIPPQQGQQGPSMQQPPPPPGPNAGDSGAIYHQQYRTLAFMACASCHTGIAPKHDRIISQVAFRSLDRQEGHKLAAEMHRRFTLPKDDPEHMPPQKDFPLRLQNELILAADPDFALASN